MKLRSLRLRQLALAAASLVLVMLVAGFAFAAIFADHTQRTLAGRLTAELDRLVALTDGTAAEPSLTSPLPDARYETPAGGIYWQLRDPASGALVRSRSLWDATLSPSANADDLATDRLPGPAGQSVLAVSRVLSFEGPDSADRPLQLTIAEDLAEVEAANAGFQADLVRALAVLAIVLLGTYWLTIEIGLSPLGRIKEDIARIGSGAEPKLDSDYPTEVVPLVSEVNGLLAAQEQSIAFARQRAADLAHGLKTSLTLMNGEAFALRHTGNATAADRIERLTNTMTETVDHQLKLSRLRHRVRSKQATPLDVTATKVVAAVRATPRGRELDWSSAIDTGLAPSLDAMDLSELLGVVLDNAAEWARHRVELAARPHDGKVLVTVDDDGPGLPDHDLAGLGERGRRLDEARPGSGLGLAIAREIVTLNGGTLEFSRSPLGGLRVTLTLAAGAAG